MDKGLAYVTTAASYFHAERVYDPEQQIRNFNKVSGLNPNTKGYNGLLRIHNHDIYSSEMNIQGRNPYLAKLQPLDSQTFPHMCLSKAVTCGIHTNIKIIYVILCHFHSWPKSTFCPYFFSQRSTNSLFLTSRRAKYSG